jgi:hypothetical protein
MVKYQLDMDEERSMRIKSPLAALFGTLALALAVAGCGPIETGGQPQATAQPAATAAPAIPTAPAQTAAPRVTPADVPTAPPPIPTEQPAPTERPAPEPIAFLPADKTWVRSGDTIMVVGGEQRQLALRTPGLPTYRYNAKVAPDGLHMAYVNEHDQLTIVDMRGNTLAWPESADRSPIGYEFSPDGRALATTFSDGQRWQLQIIDLQSRLIRTLQEGTLLAQTGDGPSLALMPIAWTYAGILTQGILWSSDAPPQGLVLVYPIDGGTQQLHQGAHIRAASTLDGRRIAVVTGETPIGPEAQPTMEIRVFERNGDNEHVIVSSRPGFVRELLWSPDGTMLLYSASEQYESQVASVVVINADGTNEQRVDFSIRGLNEMSLQDLAWADSQTALVLLANAAAQIEVNTLPVSSFDTNSLQLLETLSGQPDVDHQIVYVP